MRRLVDRRIVDLLEENNRQRFLARRAQAARQGGAGQKAGKPGIQHSPVGRPSGKGNVHSSSIQSPRSTLAGSVRVAGPMPRLLLSALLLLGIGIFSVGLGVVQAISAVIRHFWREGI